MPKTTVRVKLVGEDGNAFFIIGKTMKALKKAGYPELAEEYQDKAFASGSYDEMLRVTMEYVDTY
jgi:hypothetical protein